MNRNIKTETFEKALNEAGVLIDEMKYKGKNVYMAYGYVKGRKFRWTADGKCFTMRSEPFPSLNVTVL